MPWGTRALSDGQRPLPELFYGSWKSTQAEFETNQALRTGILAIDTAQIYRNEAEVGLGLQDGGVGSREEVYLTTKWSGMDGKGVTQSIHESLDMLKVKAVDLYLIHSPRLCRGDIPGTWAQMLQVKKEGFARSVGVSNFGIADLEEIRLSGAAMPVVNQILLHPYVLAKTLPLLLYHAQHSIVTEAYSVLIPITQDQPIAVLDVIAKREGVTEGEVLFAWARSKGAAVVTSSRSADRLRTYVRAGDLMLTPTDIEAIDEAGARGPAVNRSLVATKFLVGGAFVLAALKAGQTLGWC